MLLKIQHSCWRRVASVLVVMVAVSMIAVNPAAAFGKRRIVGDRYETGRFIAQRNWHPPVRYAGPPVGRVHHHPRVGALLAALPLGFLTLAVGSMMYYHYAGVYYQQVPTGYMVVEAPREVTVVRETPQANSAAAVSGDRVMVTAPRLNLRSGPGTGFEVISVIVKDAVLEVRGSAPEWLYVRLSDGRFGWVQQVYTTPLDSPAQG
jgi:hypothetical protein